MARDYKAENAKRAESTSRLTVQVEKELFAELKEKLYKDGETISSWCIKEIKKYLKKV